MKNILLAVLILLSVMSTANGTIISSKKTMHIKNPTSTAATDMHVKHQAAVLAVIDPNSNSSSSVFSSSGGDNNDATIRNFAGGTLGAGATVDYDVTINENVNASNLDDVEFFVSKVDFTRDNPTTGINEVFHTLEYPDGGLFQTCDDACKAKRKEFKMNVTGFTNQESFDLSNLASSTYNLFNGDPELNLQYSLFDFELWSDIPISHFAGDTLNTSNGSLLFSTDELILTPGEAFNFDIGAMNLGTYAMASIGTLIVTDLDSGESNTFSTRQFHAVSVVDEPTTWVTVIFGIVLIQMIRRKHKYVE